MSSNDLGINGWGTGKRIVLSIIVLLTCPVIVGLLALFGYWLSNLI